MRSLNARNWFGNIGLGGIGLLIAAVCVGPVWADGDDVPADAGESVAIESDVAAQAAKRAVAALVESAREVQTIKGTGGKDSDDEAETVEEPWVFKPERNRKKVSSESVTVRYRRVVREEPKWEKIYETYKKMVPVKDENGYVIGQKEVTAKRVKARRKVGVKRVERLVPDKNGPIKKVKQRAIYGPGGPDEYNGELIGNNGMALAALARGGADEELRDELAWLIAGHINLYGLPDRTRELAWVVQGMVAHDPDAHEAIIFAAVDKLMAGQIERGAAAGLWGPVSVDPVRLKYIQEANKAISAMAEKIPEDNTQAQLTIGGWRELLMTRATQRVARESFWIQGLPKNHRMKLQPSASGLAEDENVPVIVPRLPYYPLDKQVADYESTYLAVAALAAAAEAGKIPGPKDLEPIEIDRRFRFREQPRTTAMVASKVIGAMLRRQRPDGAWPGFVYDSDQRRQANADVTLTSTAYGLATVELATRLPGAERFVHTTDRRRQNARAWLDSKAAGLQTPETLRLPETEGNDPVIAWTNGTKLPDSDVAVGGRLGAWSAVIAMAEIGAIESSTRDAVAQHGAPEIRGSSQQVVMLCPFNSAKLAEVQEEAADDRDDRDDKKKKPRGGQWQVTKQNRPQIGRNSIYVAPTDLLVQTQLALGLIDSPAAARVEGAEAE